MIYNPAPDPNLNSTLIEVPHCTGEGWSNKNTEPKPFVLRVDLRAEAQPHRAASPLPSLLKQPHRAASLLPSLSSYNGTSPRTQRVSTPAKRQKLQRTRTEALDRRTSDTGVAATGSDKLDQLATEHTPMHAGLSAEVSQEPELVPEPQPEPKKIHHVASVPAAAPSPRWR